MRSYFVTGGTGFVGRALVRELLKREDTQRLCLLTRRTLTQLEAENHPGIGNDRVEFWRGDITECEFPKLYYTDIIHAAAEANDLLAPDKPKYYYDVVEGARRIFEWGRQMASKADNMRMLFVSSGAVLKGDSVYCRAKRMAEGLSPVWARIGRIYSLVGPEMPMNGQYALGRFIWDAVTNGRVEYYDSGSVRSYLHVDDCARMLLDSLDYYEPLATDIGSLQPVTINELARIVGEIAGVPVMEIPRKDFHQTAQVYLPKVENMFPRLYSNTHTLEDSIREVIEYQRSRIRSD